ncbi:probable L-cysteine desulfhydrase, chloroplastic [Nymphaea colorata]|uniref:Aminotransferase class V domain-containing protein n=1 Tax=Nymphaea colorata TaxID=210225 RepID=A0A5K0X2T1_9MAGN|nr:probable L-cysteine desulfhydrase, chloroplastic [Nymphaea colorata]
MDEVLENGTNNHQVAKKPKLSHQSDNLSDLIRREFAHHDPHVARVNNGSFGSCPASILDAQRRWQNEFLRQPDRFYFGPLQEGIRRSREAIAAVVNAAHPDEISLIDNATTATAIVLQHLAWSFTEGKYPKGDSVIMLHYAYGAVKKSIHAYCARAGATVVEVQMPFPVSSDEEIILEFRKALEKGKSGGRKVRLAVIDHITSMPTVVIPVKELTRICREEGVDRVFIDAAHAIGNVEIDLQSIGADFYTSNLHKWLFCPPSVAFLYCKRTASADVHHPVVSHEYGNGLAIESAWIGTRDYSSQLVVPSVFEFLENFEGGIDGIRKRNHANVLEMGKMLAKAWGTQLGAPPEMSCSMIMVGLPSSLKIQSNQDAIKLRTHLRVTFGVEVPIHYAFPKDLEGRDTENCTSGYARISHQIYNTVDDYYKLRDAIKKLVEDSITCEKLAAN